MRNIPSLTGSLAKFNKGCLDFYQALYLRKKGYLLQFQIYLNEASVQIIGALEWALKYYFSIIRKIDISSKRFVNLIELMKNQAIPPLEENKIRLLHKYRKFNRNEPIHRGYVPHIEDVKGAIDIINEIFQIYFSIEKENLIITKLPEFSVAIQKPTSLYDKKSLEVLAIQLQQHFKIIEEGLRNQDFMQNWVIKLNDWAIENDLSLSETLACLEDIIGEDISSDELVELREILKKNMDNLLQISTESSIIRQDSLLTLSNSIDHWLQRFYEIKEKIQLNWPSNYDDKLHVISKTTELTEEEFPQFFRGFDKIPHIHGRFYEVDFLGIPDAIPPLKPTIIQPPEELLREIDEKLSYNTPVLISAPLGSSKSTIAMGRAVQRHEESWIIQVCETVGYKGDMPSWHEFIPENSMAGVLFRLKKMKDIAVQDIHKIVGFFLIVEDLHLDSEKKIELLEMIMNELEYLRKRNLCADYQILLTARIDKQRLSWIFENATESRKHFIDLIQEVKIKEDYQDRIKNELLDLFFKIKINENDPRKKIISNNFSGDYLTLGVACLTAFKNFNMKKIELKDIYNYIRSFLKPIIAKFVQDPNYEKEYLIFQHGVCLFLPYCVASMFETLISPELIYEIFQSIQAHNKKLEPIFNKFSSKNTKSLWLLNKFFDFLLRNGLIDNIDPYHKEGRIWHSKLAQYYLNALLDDPRLQNIVIFLRKHFSLILLNRISPNNHSRLFYEHKWFFNLVLKMPNQYLKKLKAISFGDYRGVGILKRYNIQEIPEFIFNCSNLEFLELTNNELKSIPNSISNLNKLRQLDLSVNKLENLPNSIGSLKKLKKLDLHYNYLTELPLSLENLQLLKRLRLSANKLVDLPETLWNLKNLEVLNLGGNNLKILPSLIEKLKNLKELHLHKNGLQKLSDSICNLQGLKLLRVSLNNLKKVPELIGNLQSLEKLDITYNEITSLPESIGNLHNIQVLMLWDNLITKIPESIGKLQKLKVLFISNNKIKIIPESIGNLNSLEDFDISINHLNRIPETLGNLKNLKRLELYQNCLNSIPDSFFQLQNLEKLDISRNQLSKISKNIFKLNKLETLHLEHNKLENLPDTLGNLTNLQLLFIHNNELNSLPNTLYKLQNLKHLSVSMNKLEELPNSIGEMLSIELLDLSKNKIKTLPDSIGNLKNLKTIKLQNNKLKSIPKSIGNLKMLKEIDIGNNSIEELPVSIKYLKNITKIEISNTNINLKSKFIQSLLNKSCIFHEKPSIKFSSYRKSITTSYQGIFLIEEEVKVLEDLERIIGRSIPCINEVKYDSFGFQASSNFVIALGLSNNNLNKIPKSIANLRNLQLLGLRKNQFTNLPEFIGNLKALQKLWIDHNKITNLPKSIGGLSEIKELWIDDNRLRNFPEFICELSSLEALDLSFNFLKSIPDSIINCQNLQILVIAGNNFLNFPDNIKPLQKRGCRIIF
ncbi:MAG: hypothetical protein ACFFD2_06215 [Promethearchaeota archaeon]